MKPAIIYPMGFYFFYIFVLVLFMFKSRKKAVLTGRVNYKFFKSYQGEIPADMVILGRHFDNQFQIPMLFFITCTLSIIVLRNDFWCSVFAWCFVLSRFLHSFVYLGSNSLKIRPLVYGLGILFLSLIWIRILI